MEKRKIGQAGGSASKRNCVGLETRLSHNDQTIICRELLEKLRNAHRNEYGQSTLDLLLQDSTVSILFESIQKKLNHGDYETIDQFVADMENLLGDAKFAYQVNSEEHQAVNLWHVFLELKCDMLGESEKASKMDGDEDAAAEISEIMPLQVETDAGVSIHSEVNNGAEVGIEKMEVEKPSVKRGRKPTLKKPFEKTNTIGSEQKSTKMSWRKLAASNAISTAGALKMHGKSPLLKRGYYLTGLMGGQVLVCDGHVFYASFPGRWKCCEKRNMCRCCATSTDLSNGQVLVKLSSNHSHGPPDKKRIIELKVYHEMKRLALDDMGKNEMEVIQESINAVAGADKVKLRPKNSLINMIRRCRSRQQDEKAGSKGKSKNQMRVNISNATLVAESEEVQTTISGQRLMIRCNEPPEAATGGRNNSRTTVLQTTAVNSGMPESVNDAAAADGSPSSHCGYYLTGVYGGKLLVCNGYAYYRTGSTLWKCSDKKKHKIICNGSATPVDLPDGQVLVKLGHDHSHDPDEKKIIMLKLYNEIKRLALDDMTKSETDVVQESINSVEGADTLQLQSTIALVKMVRQFRSEHLNNGAASTNKLENRPAKNPRITQINRSTATLELRTAESNHLDIHPAIVKVTRSTNTVEPEECPVTNTTLRSEAFNCTNAISTISSRQSSPIIVDAFGGGASAQSHSSSTVSSWFAHCHRLLYDHHLHKEVRCSECMVTLGLCTYTSINDLAEKAIDHARIHSRHLMFTCRICKNKYKTKAEVMTHLEELHRLDFMETYLEDASDQFKAELIDQLTKCFGGIVKSETGANNGFVESRPSSYAPRSWLEEQYGSLGDI